MQDDEELAEETVEILAALGQLRDETSLRIIEDLKFPYAGFLAKEWRCQSCGFVKKSFKPRSNRECGDCPKCGQAKWKPL
jgi:rubrerythrin